MPERRGSWYLLTGLLLGAALGLLYAWIISPVHYIDTSPSSMRAEFKDRYRSLIAAAYAADGDVNRASARLSLLNEPNIVQVLAAQAQQDLANGGDPSEARSLALLASALGNQPASVPTTTGDPIPTKISPSPTLQITATFTPSPTQTITLTITRTASLTPGLTQIVRTVTPTSSLTPTPVISPGGTRTSPTISRITPSPTPTSTATPGQPFIVISRSQVCDPNSLAPLLQVQMNDAAGHPVPGVQINITWQGGADSFFTGLQPAINPGYADFVMTPKVIYTLQVADGGQPVSNISAPQCTDQGGQSYWGGWSLKMAQP